MKIIWVMLSLLLLIVIMPIWLRGQSSGSGTITSHSFTVVGDPCSFTDASGYEWKGTVQIDKATNLNLIMGCDPSDGPAPYYQEWRWYCTDHYVLDGFKVTWPNGNFGIEPSRCKADVKYPIRSAG